MSSSKKITLTSSDGESFEVDEAANYLHIQSLLDLFQETVLDKIRGRTTEQIRQALNIVNDCNPEEEEEGLL